MLGQFFFCLVGLLTGRVTAQNSVTCDGLGAFTDDPPFDRLPLPHCPEELGIDLHLEYFNRAFPNLGESIVGIDRTTIPSTWDSTLETVFVVHGWTNDVDTGWLEGFKDQHLNFMDVNVVVVGWGGPYGAGDINYQWSASTTRTIGAHVAEVIENLIVAGNAAQNSFHIVGHSLGAHVSGHAGRWSSVQNGRLLRRVTGMDPAGPEFVTVDDRTIGLWTDCAALVDTLNTDQLLGSTPTSTGHQNYYPNGGRDQPGCNIGEDTCSHIRALWLYEESLDHSCFFYSRERCSDPSNLPGSCTSCVGPCGAMGQPAELDNYQNGDYYLTTNSDTAPNYCEG